MFIDTHVHLNNPILYEKIDQVINEAKEAKVTEFIVVGYDLETSKKAIEIAEKYKSVQRYKDILEVTDGRLVPAWLEANHDNLSGTVKEMPTREQIDVPVNEMLIVELYSK